MARESTPDTPIHIRPHAPVAERVLLPGDPGRALRLAQRLLDKPRMLNHNRGLWGYTGLAADEEPLTIQSTGMGGPSAAIVVEELIRLGARRLVRVGTCGALAPDLSLGRLVVARTVLPADGTSRALGARDRLEPDPTLLARLAAAAGDEAAVVDVVTTDLFYAPDGQEAGWRSAGAAAVEMEAAAVLAVAARRAVQAACVLAVTDLLRGTGRRRIAEESLLEAEGRLGDVGAAALAAEAPEGARAAQAQAG